MLIQYVKQQQQNKHQNTILKKRKRTNQGDDSENDDHDQSNERVPKIEQRGDGKRPIKRTAKMESYAYQTEIKKDTISKKHQKKKIPTSDNKIQDI